MKVPVAWLREYVEASPSPGDLAKLLVMAGVGIESIEGGVLDLEITANRADLLSMLGVAREVGVLLRTPVREPQVPPPSPVALPFPVEVLDPGLCPRYTAREIRGVKVAPSPAWMAERLQAAGVRPINNVVDVTNYVLLETGQPLHAFDLKQLRGGRIVVRRAKPGEKIAAIDAKEYALTPDALVIADAERPVAIAGVMGGRESEIGPSTVDVLIESAQFDPVSIRRTSRRLGLSSESSYRFERGVDYATIDWASRRAVQMIVAVAGGVASQGVVDVSVPAPAQPAARVRPSRVRRVLGLDVSPSRIREILTGLGCLISDAEDALTVTSPPGRRDLRIEADYIEEVARVEGYDRIPCDTQLGLSVAVDRPDDRVREEARAALAGMGGYEVLTWSFAEAGAANRVPFWSAGPLIPLRDPQGQVDRTLRESLVPGLLKVLETNESYKESLRPVFEIAHVYRRDGKGYGDLEVLGLAVPGDPLGVKGFLETVLRLLGVAYEIVPSSPPPLSAFLVAGTSAEVRVQGRVVGYLGAPRPGLTGLRGETGVAEVDFVEIAGAARLVAPYREFNRQPPVERDLSIVVADAVAWTDVESTVRSAASPTLESIRFLSEYRGKPIEPSHKGWAFSMVFRAVDRTLTGEEVEAAVQRILKALQGKVGARLR